MLKLYYRHYSWVATRQLDKLMPFWQPANILHSVLIFMLLWQINIVVVVSNNTDNGISDIRYIKRRIMACP